MAITSSSVSPFLSGSVTSFAGLCVPFLVDEPLVFVQNVVGLGCLHCCIVFGEQLDPGLSFGQKQPKEDHSEGLYWLPAVLLDLPRGAGVVQRLEHGSLPLLC